MVKFTSYTKSANKLTNKAGGIGYNLAPIEKLVQIVSTFLYKEPKFYGDVSKSLENAIKETAKTEPEFILKLAAYSRNKMNMRTVSIYLLVISANINECKPYVRKYAPYIIKRADEILEALSCQLELFSNEIVNGKHINKKIPNSLKKGIADSFRNFDEYQYAKWG
jgi:60 kDa SS-A/Ro ribonucleoprotein